MRQTCFRFIYWQFWSSGWLWWPLVSSMGDESMTIEMVKNVLERCAAREEAALLDATEGSWANGFSDGQALGYRWALELLSRLDKPETVDSMMKINESANRLRCSSWYSDSPGRVTRGSGELSSIFNLHLTRFKTWCTFFYSENLQWPRIRSDAHEE